MPREKPPEPLDFFIWTVEVHSCISTLDRGSFFPPAFFLIRLEVRTSRSFPKSALIRFFDRFFVPDSSSLSLFLTFFSHALAWRLSLRTNLPAINGPGWWKFDWWCFYGIQLLRSDEKGFPRRFSSFILLRSIFSVHWIIKKLVEIIMRLGDNLFSRDVISCCWWSSAELQYSISWDMLFSWHSGEASRVMDHSLSTIFIPYASSSMGGPE